MKDPRKNGTLVAKFACFRSVHPNKLVLSANNIQNPWKKKGVHPEKLVF